MGKKKVTYLLLVLAVLLLMGSAVGSTRAALTYYSENYTAEITVSQIGVSLLENGEVVSSRDYNQNEWQTGSNRGKGTKGDVITTVYKYDGVEFHVDVEVDAVQTHNAQDAIKSAWGVDAEDLGIL
ncbi:MAG: hypothetical protein HFI68_03120 [Lachnospiraceae bacterium]|nr:hypothetical protein [Lachnospiraceae bacterium]